MHRKTSAVNGFIYLRGTSCQRLFDALQHIYRLTSASDTLQQLNSCVRQITWAIAFKCGDRSTIVGPTISLDMHEQTFLHMIKTLSTLPSTKAHRKVASPIGTFSTPTALFDQVCIDISGSFKPTRRYTYLLTCIV